MKERVYRERQRSEKSYLKNLIKAMEPGDKRFFKRYLQRNSASDEPDKMAALFDIIDDIEDDTDDDRKIRERLKKKGFDLDIGTYKVDKQRLYESILVAMRTHISSYYDPIGPTIKSRLLDINFLVDKGQIEQALYELSRIRGVAEKYEKINDLLEIFDFEIKLLLQVPLKNYSSEYHKEVHADLQLYGEKAKNNLYFLNQYLRMVPLFDEHYFFRKGKMDENSKKLQAVLENTNPIEDNYLTLNSRILKCLCDLILKEHMFSVKQELTDEQIRLAYAELYLEYKRYLASFEGTENFKEIITGCEFSFFAFLEHMQRAARRNTKHEVKYVTDKIMNFPFTNRALKASQQVLGYIGELSNAYISGQFITSDRSYAHKVRALLDEYDDLIKGDQKLRIMFTVGRMLFATGHYEVAREWFIKITNLKTDSETRKDLKSTSHIMICLADYELKDYSTLKSSVQNAKRFFDESEMELEKDFVQFFSTAVTSDGKEVDEKNLIHQLEKLKEDQRNRNFFSLFDFISWFKASTTNDFEEMIYFHHQKIGAS